RFRAVIVRFLGEPRDQQLYDHVHESPSLMTIPLWILAALSIVAGVINLPLVLTMEHWLEPAVGHHEEPVLTLELLALTLSVIIALFGATLAWARYARNENWAQRIANSFSGLIPAAENAWWVDSIYSRFIVQPLRDLSVWFAA